MRIENLTNEFPKKGYSYTLRIRDILGIKPEEKTHPSELMIKAFHIPRELSLDLGSPLGEVSLEAIETNYKKEIVDHIVKSLWDFVLDCESASDSSLQKLSNIQKMSREK